jgi:hypothetical protein
VVSQGISFESAKKRREYTPTDQDFTVIDFPGATQTTSLGISDCGDIIGDYRLSDGLFHAYLLSKGQFTFLEPLLERPRTSPKALPST